MIQYAAWGSGFKSSRVKSARWKPNLFCSFSRCRLCQVHRGYCTNRNRNLPLRKSTWKKWRERFHGVLYCSISWHCPFNQNRWEGMFVRIMGRSILFYRVQGSYLGEEGGRWKPMLLCFFSSGLLCHVCNFTIYCSNNIKLSAFEIVTLVYRRKSTGRWREWERLHEYIV